jgi:hypothetical protein
MSSNDQNIRHTLDRYSLLCKSQYHERKYSSTIKTYLSHPLNPRVARFSSRTLSRVPLHHLKWKWQKERIRYYGAPSGVSSSPHEFMPKTWNFIEIAYTGLYRYRCHSSVSSSPSPYKLVLVLGLYVKLAPIVGAPGSITKSSSSYC